MYNRHFFFLKKSICKEEEILEKQWLFLSNEVVVGVFFLSVLFTHSLLGMN